MHLFSTFVDSETTTDLNQINFLFYFLFFGFGSVISQVMIFKERRVPTKLPNLSPVSISVCTYLASVYIFCVYVCGITLSVRTPDGTISSLSVY